MNKRIYDGGFKSLHTYEPIHSVYMYKYVYVKFQVLFPVSEISDFILSVYKEYFALKV